MSNPVPFPPKSEARSPSMEVDKGRVVRGAANCRVGTASLMPGGERPRGGPLEKAAKREKKRMGERWRGRIGATEGSGRIRPPPIWSARPRVDGHTGGRSSMKASRLEGETNQSREPGEGLDSERG